MSLLEELTTLLQQDPRLVTDGQLLKNQITELALKLDPDLLRLVLSQPRLKNHFFAEVDGVLVFDKEKFIRFVNNKAFLPDSYTSFKNKIGLTTTDGRYLSESRDVVLAWPYKDCVLEGGQTKEDQKRDEIFWNETLAPDDIDRLLAPKVLTRWRRYDADGEHPVTEFSDADNLIIKGNNLLALHSLKKRFAGKVKLIYIDPPYNTGNDEFKYNDSFNHSTWLTFMKNRLEIASKLLREDGAICVQISDIGVSRLRLLSDEVFEAENFINKITVSTRAPSGFKTVNIGVFETAEYVLLYAKNKEKWRYEPQYVETDYDRNYRYVILNKKDAPANWVYGSVATVLSQELGYEGVSDAREQLSKEVFQNRISQYALENADRVFRFTEINPDAGKDTLKVKEVSIGSPERVFIVEREQYPDRFVLNGKEITFYEKKIRDLDGEPKPTTLMTNIWTDIPWEGIANEGGVKLKRGKKPEKLIKRFLDLATEPGNLVLDFFLGSGTTAAVAHKMGQQYLGVEQLDYGDNDSVVRLSNVINGDTTGISKTVNWQGGGSFVCCELMEWNERFVQRVLAASDNDTLQAIWDEMREKAHLSYGLDLQQFDEYAAELADLSPEDQRRFLMEVLDKNQLYVPLSEMDDETYAVSEEDKSLNRLFYGV